MPPKPSKKQQEKKQKIAEDKTFGLKNKNKSKKVQQYVNQVQSQSKEVGDRKARERLERENQLKLEKKKLEEQKKKDLELFNNTIIIQPKVPFGTDPKSVLCAHFKAGQCNKASRCKYSHDLNVGRKVQKANLYEDKRDDADKEDDNMEDWNQEKLEDAIREREVGRENLNKATEIVCKYFIEAIETQKYGWFWDCPNGRDCKYRHALPPGFVLKKKETEEERREREEREKANEITIEDFLEKERHNLGSNLTPVTHESFLQWKKERKARQNESENLAAKLKSEAMTKMKAGMKTGMTFSGKDMFDFNPDWANTGDDDAMDVYEREGSDVEDIEQIDTVMRSVSVDDLQIDDVEELE
ncbi:hypothetical protein BC833DRAFT_605007 [Globomyces pollinis-pini]|nr:hypothetical protein BC833DRAFT_605007 [Globomyces pollinis-pini]